MTTITIEQLAEKINGKLWTKGEMKRIYVDAGYNTKKMTTKTYVYQREDGTFGVSCYIDCPSQAFQWIKSQQQEVIEGVEKQIEKAITHMQLTLVDFKVTTENSEELLVYVKFADEEPVWYDEKQFFNKFEEYPENIFEGLPEIASAPMVYDPSENTASTPAPVENIENPTYGVGEKVKHARFGEGEVLAESKTIIEVRFATDTKKLLKDYAKLEKI